ncbi:MAG TPA: isocitrate lyase/phosphoenolpyruvate mutase family protein [Candidatus Binataceae bacterium]|nr:isocitrate lyase/phosphoenolpyruvate mutase family protein [Candidatus Binataceae bacterium]
MNSDTQRAHARAFRAMHDRSRLLILPNAWDAMSARVIETAGARAIATSSAGLAYSLGYADGEYAPREEVIQAIGRIARVVHVPLSTDIESGFGADERELADMVAAVIDAGAVGINLEDSTGDPAHPLYELETAVARVRAARTAAEKSGIPLVINARTDVLITLKGDRAGLLEESFRRANAFRAAGADSLFPLGLGDAEEISRAARAIDGPINVIFRPGIPPAAELARLGAARLSMGSAVALAAATLTRRIAQELLSEGTYSMLGTGFTHVEFNALMSEA